MASDNQNFSFVINSDAELYFLLINNASLKKKMYNIECFINVPCNCGSVVTPLQFVTDTEFVCLLHIS